MLRDPLVSIIVPVYNAEKFLSRCLASLVGQTYKNIEIVVVNDGSSDKSQDIINEFRMECNAIKAFLIKNSGAGEARNYAFKYITGELVMFVDADDWIDEDCVYKCVNYFKEYKDLECVIFPYIREFYGLSRKNNMLGDKTVYFHGDGNILYRRLFGLVGKEKACPASLDDLNLSMCKMYYTKFMQNKFFPKRDDIVAGEDLWYNLKVFEHMNNILYTTDTYYHYNKENDKSVTKIYRKDDVDKFKNLFKFMENTIIKNNLSDVYKEALNNRKVLSITNYVRNIMNSDMGYKEKSLGLFEVLSRKDIIKSFKSFDFKYLPLHWKLFFWLCKKQYIKILMIISMLGEKFKYFFK